MMLGGMWKERGRVTSLYSLNLYYKHPLVDRRTRTLHEFETNNMPYRLFT